MKFKSSIISHKVCFIRHGQYLGNLWPILATFDIFVCLSFKWKQIVDYKRCMWSWVQLQVREIMWLLRFGVSFHGNWIQTVCGLKHVRPQSWGELLATWLVVQTFRQVVGTLDLQVKGCWFNPHVVVIGWNYYFCTVMVKELFNEHMWCSIKVTWGSSLE